MENATVGTIISNNSELIALPVATILIDENGTSFRVGETNKGKVIVMQAANGKTYAPVQEQDLPEGDYTFVKTVIWMR
jgi:hypothetical protein